MRQGKGERKAQGDKDTKEQDLAACCVWCERAAPMRNVTGLEPGLGGPYESSRKAGETKGVWWGRVAESWSFEAFEILGVEPWGEGQRNAILKGKSDILDDNEGRRWKNDRCLRGLAGSGAKGNCAVLLQSRSCYCPCVQGKETPWPERREGCHWKQVISQ